MPKARDTQQEQLEAQQTESRLAGGHAGRLAAYGSCLHHALVLDSQEYVEGLGYLQVLTCVSCLSVVRRHRHTKEPDITLF